ncbi:MAG: amylo-alpha-1,6-glucosidase [Bacteroidia bacterium]|nr:amylo-alpha-1,6-glucosidase [Bacteroidia bacterium]MDW8236522.1 amylo-alpha-1,6-glucosidase [Bacteroidia bacterium]
MQRVGRIPLIEPRWALSRELFRSTSWGGFAMTTLWGCPTRKYHSWFSLWRGLERYELLPQIQEELHLKEGTFLLSTQHFHGKLGWEGYRHLEEFRRGSAWSWTYHIGELRVERTLYLSPDVPIWVMRYTFSEGVLFRWIPLWAVRRWHTLRKEPLSVRRQGHKLFLGSSFQLYFHVEPVPRFIPWEYAYEGVYYPQEAARGYEATETLYAAECWEWRLHEPGTITIQFGLQEEPKTLVSIPEYPEVKGSLIETLTSVAENFFIHTNEGEYLIAGHPWFGSWARDTFISLPGLTLALDEEERFHRVMETALRHLSPEGRLPEVFPAQIGAPDAGLWFFWTLIQAVKMGVSPTRLWERYGEAIHQILVYYLKYHAGEDGLLRVDGASPASWMDAVVEGKPAVPRKGALVEWNALWYAALRFVSETAPQEGMRWRWGLAAQKVQESFKPTFWEKAKGYLADWRSAEEVSWQVRPNQLFAAALPYRPISEKIAELILETVEKDLLTPRGIRTLSPADPEYHGHYEGSQTARDLAYHNGTAWPWLLPSYGDAKIAIWGKEAALPLQKLLQGLEQALFEYGWGAIAEIYDGDAPHVPRGAPAQAWSIAEILRLHYTLSRL